MSLYRLAIMFHIHDDPDEKAGVRVNAIHDERGYRRMRRELSRQYEVGHTDPNIEIVDVDLAGDRRLILRHDVLNRALLQEGDAKLVLQHLAFLWTHDVLLQEVNATGDVLKEHAASPRSLASALQ
jgi:stage V sporulation protein R